MDKLLNHYPALSASSARRKASLSPAGSGTKVRVNAFYNWKPIMGEIYFNWYREGVRGTKGVNAGLRLTPFQQETRFGGNCMKLA